MCLLILLDKRTCIWSTRIINLKTDSGRYVFRKQRKWGWFNTVVPPLPHRQNEGLTFQLLFLQNYPNSLQFEEMPGSRPRTPAMVECPEFFTSSSGLFMGNAPTMSQKHNRHRVHMKLLLGYNHMAVNYE